MVSDTYTVRYLLQATEAMPAQVVWREHTGGLASHHDGVDLLLTELHTRLGVRVGLRFRYRDDELWLYSPLPVGWLGREYASEAERDLAELLNTLLHSASIQCARKMNYDYEHPEEVRERIYQQLLFGQPAAVFGEGSH
jgi:hypothetical protein